MGVRRIVLIAEPILALESKFAESANGTERQLPGFVEWVTGSAIAPAVAAANLQQLESDAVLEALLGSKLEQLGGHAQQYVTAAVERRLRPFEGVAAAGWWCAGLDPLTDFHGRMEWGCWKPAAPRLSSEGKPIKYEHPQGVPTRTFWLQVPAAIARSIAACANIPEAEIPQSVLTGEEGAFWRWWQVEKRLPLFITEGVKKAACLLSAGVPAVALPGIWNGTTKAGVLRDDLASQPLDGRTVVILFDHSDKERGQRDLRRAIRRLAHGLEQVSAAVEVAVLPGPEKGIDDYLAAGRSLGDVALVSLAEFRAYDRRCSIALRRCPHQVATTQYLSDAVTVPGDAPLVTIKAPMGAGKTALLERYLQPLIRDGVPVVVLTHRRSLGAALSERLGVPFAEECLPGSPLRLIGLGLCVDSAHPESSLRFIGSSWDGCVVVIDEAVQVIDHLLNGRTAIADNRAQVLEQLSGLLSIAAQVVAMDALLDDTTIKLLEQLTGNGAHLIVGAHRPADGRRCLVHPSEESWLAQLRQLVEEGRRLLITCTAQQAKSRFSAQGLAALVQQWRPEAKVLVVDSDTVHNPSHHASLLPADPASICRQYDYVIASPVIETGVSIDLAGHFSAVFSICGGNTAPEGVAQATARLRDDVDRHLFAPLRSRGRSLRIGCGSFVPDELLKASDQQTRLQLAAMAQVGLTACTVAPIASVWMQQWAELAARRNVQALEYRDWVLAYLSAEGYQLVEVEESDEATAAGKEITADLRETAQAKAEAECQAVAAAEPIDATTAKEWARSDYLSAEQRQQLEAHGIRERYGVEPTAELVEADRDGLYSRLQLLFWLTTGRQQVERRDAAVLAKLSRAGSRKVWAPDANAATVTMQVQLLETLGVLDWLQRGDAFTADDPQLLELADKCQRYRPAIAQVLGCSFSPTARPTTIVRQLLDKVGHQLQAKKVSCGGVKVWTYRVAASDAPLDVAAVFERWLAQASGSKILVIDNGEILEPSPRGTTSPPKGLAAAASLCGSKIPVIDNRDISEPASTPTTGGLS